LTHRRYVHVVIPDVHLAIPDVHLVIPAKAGIHDLLCCREG